MPTYWLFAHKYLLSASKCQQLSYTLVEKPRNIYKSDINTVIETEASKLYLGGRIG